VHALSPALLVLHLAATPADEVHSRVVPLVQAKMDTLRDFFGIESIDQLKVALSFDMEDAKRSDAWLLSHLQDGPNELATWKHVFERDPHDLEAASRIADMMPFLDGREAAVDFLSTVDFDHLVLRDRRGQDTPAAQVEATLAYELLELGRTQEAMSHARHSLKLGGDGRAHRMLAIGLLEQDKPQLAVDEADLSAADEPAIPFSYFLQGVARAKLGRADDAQRSWEYAAYLDRSWVIPVRLLRGEWHSIRDWLLIDDDSRTAAFGEGLAHCGHYYLDLDMKDRAERCFALADKIDPIPGQMMRLSHLAESDPDAALAQGEGVLAKNRHTHVLALVGWLYENYGRYPEARALMEEGLRKDPWSRKLNGEIQDVCGWFKDSLCIAVARWRLGIAETDTHLPLLWVFHWLPSALRGDRQARAQIVVTLTHQPRQVVVGAIATLVAVAGAALLIRRRLRRRALARSAEGNQP
jgi:tetratricopeptide (TPR) repeat protein